ncbi:MAG TPA: hypothetical protein VHR44_01545 [Beijerinckiaceae bacterium]|jgi:hypothetical protein|nr:hypothetical protein [Beijerinckiaceae bacterium]
MPELVGVLTPNRQPALTSAKRMARGLDEIRAVDFGYVYKNGKLTDQTGIRFHMNRKRRLADLPIDQRLPNTIDGVEVDVLEVGYTPHQGGPRSPHDPLQPGISVGTKKRLWTGTLGPIVRDLNAGQLCLLSNWHVLCGGADAAPGDEITQPGPMDMMGGRTVGLLERWLRLNEQYDAAVARLTPGAHAILQLFGTQYAPTVTKAPALGMRLMKSGAVSGITQARVDQLSARLH